MLLPAHPGRVGFLSESIFPLLQAIGQFISAVFNLALRVLAGLWQNILLPALQKAYDFLAGSVFPIFKSVGDYVSKTFTPTLTKLSSFLTATLVPAFQGISNAIKTVIDWLTSMAEKLNSLTLPSWLTPGSPTPWEIGLIGINEAMRQLNQQLPAMAINLNQVNLWPVASLEQEALRASATRRMSNSPSMLRLSCRDPRRRAAWVPV